MIGHRSILAIACVALASCAGSTPRAVKTVQYKECAGAGAVANTCEPFGQWTRCRVWVFERANAAPVVYPHTLKTPGPTPNITDPKTVIVWILRGGRFRDRADGPDLAASAPEFRDGAPSDESGLQELPGPDRNYRIKFLNSIAGDYKYTIKFQDSSGDEVTCDPRINNSGG
jgi:hypothetical protein